MTTPAPQQPIDIAIPADTGSPAQLRQFAQQTIRCLRQHAMDARITAGAEAANVRRVTIQIVNRRREALEGRYPIDVQISTTQSGAPINSQTASVVSGVLLDTYVNNAALKILTDGTGKIELDVTVAGAGTRWITAVVPGWAAETSFEWT